MHALAYEILGKDLDKRVIALELYRRAARLGFEPSAWNLARYYDVNHRPRSYFYWLRRSAELGNLEAEIEARSPFPYTVAAAAELQARGLLTEAKRLFGFAAKYGNDIACQSLKELVRT